MMPPDTAPLTATLDADYAALQRDAECWRRLNAPHSLVLVEPAEFARLQEIERRYLALLAQMDGLTEQIGRLVAEARARNAETPQVLARLTEARSKAEGV